MMHPVLWSCCAFGFCVLIPSGCNHPYLRINLWVLCAVWVLLNPLHVSMYQQWWIGVTFTFSVWKVASCAVLHVISNPLFCSSQVNLNSIFCFYRWRVRQNYWHPLLRWRSPLLMPIHNCKRRWIPSKSKTSSCVNKKYEYHNIQFLSITVIFLLF